MLSDDHDHDHKTFHQQYACYIQDAGRLRARGSGSATPEIANLDQCRQMYNSLKLMESTSLVLHSSKAIIDSGVKSTRRVRAECLALECLAHLCSSSHLLSIQLDLLGKV